MRQPCQEARSSDADQARGARRARCAGAHAGAPPPREMKATKEPAPPSDFPPSAGRRSWADSKPIILIFRI